MKRNYWLRKSLLSWLLLFTIQYTLNIIWEKRRSKLTFLCVFSLRSFYVLTRVKRENCCLPKILFENDLGTRRPNNRIKAAAGSTIFTVHIIILKICAAKTREKKKESIILRCCMLLCTAQLISCCQCVTKTQRYGLVISTCFA